MFNFWRRKPAPADAAPASAGVVESPREVAAPAPVAVAAPAPTQDKPRSWRERLGGSAFTRSLGALFSRNPKLDEDLLEELETTLLTADVGVATTALLVDGLRKRMKAREFADANALLDA